MRTRLPFAIVDPSHQFGAVASHIVQLTQHQSSNRQSIDESYGSITRNPTCCLVQRSFSHRVVRRKGQLRRARKKFKPKELMERQLTTSLLGLSDRILECRVPEACFWHCMRRRLVIYRGAFQRRRSGHGINSKGLSSRAATSHLQPGITPSARRFGPISIGTEGENWKN